MDGKTMFIVWGMTGTARTLSSSRDELMAMSGQAGADHPFTYLSNFNIPDGRDLLKKYTKLINITKYGEQDIGLGHFHLRVFGAPPCLQTYSEETDI